MTKGFFASLTRHVPPGQLSRYLVVGVGNTIFSYGSFAFFTALLDQFIPASYVVANLISSLLNISVSFLGYKWFVFRTKGNYLAEWIRCLMVYSGSIAIGLIMLPLAVITIAFVTGDSRSAPYIAGALLMATQVLFSFFGHRAFSFKTSTAKSDAAARDLIDN